jgi:predicted glycosyltransferase
LPSIRSWTQQHFEFSGYITGVDPIDIADRAGLRHRFGYGDDEKVCIVTVGGSAVGGALLRRVIDSTAAVRRVLPEMRFVIVTGPRIDPASLPYATGVEVHGYVTDLHLRLAACDIAVVQGGLTTCMELTAASVPFIYFPLHNHFEQNVHVRYRLNRYAAGQCLDYVRTSAEGIAAAIIATVGQAVRYRTVETKADSRAARLLLDLL